MAYKVNIRDRFVEWASNLLIERVATEKYRRYTHAIYNLGLIEFDRHLEKLKRTQAK